jgi:hypothetical protein
MERQKYNKLILETLSKLVEKYPDLRFGQILVDCDIIRYEPSVLCDGQREDILVIDPFYEEPEITWNRVKDNKFAFKEQYN